MRKEQVYLRFDKLAEHNDFNNRMKFSSLVIHSQQANVFLVAYLKLDRIDRGYTRWPILVLNSFAGQYSIFNGSMTYTCFQYLYVTGHGKRAHFAHYFKIELLVFKGSVDLKQ